MLNFCHKLKGLKETVSRWIRDKKKAYNLELHQLEKQLQDSTAANVNNSLSLDSFGIMKQLELKKEELLLQEEKEWRLKSRAIWISHGDKNTKFFHSFASARRRSKYIWEIFDDNGVQHSGIDSIKSESYSYFGNIYSDLGDCYLSDQINVASLYPRFFDE